MLLLPTTVWIRQFGRRILLSNSALLLRTTPQVYLPLHKMFASRHGTRGSDHLRFDLDDLKSYTPGDTISGSVVRCKHIVSFEATLTLSLLGRMNGHLKPRDEDQQVSDDWTLFHTLEEVLFSGPLHLPEASSEPLRWSFTIQIPTKPVDTLTKSRTQAGSFLPIDENARHHGLPGTFKGLGRDSNFAAGCFIEYWLTASLKHTFGSPQKSMATSVVKIDHPHEMVPNDQPEQLTNLSLEGKVQTQRLLLAANDTTLSFKQMVQRLTRSSKVPKVSFQINLTYPRILDINRSNFPLVLDIARHGENTSDSLKNTRQEAQINWFKMSLISYSHIIVADRPPFGNVHKDIHRSSIDAHLDRTFDKPDSPLVLPLGDQHASLNLGELFQLAFHKEGLSYRVWRPSHASRPYCVFAPIYPDFVTYNIKHTHGIDWQVSVTIAGETQVLRKSVPIKVIQSTPEI
ncbi:unnamed protein product [Penicillium salamii]|uniref:Arrestin-like N-terminal domain-containing protein n=1 Tax=Penicillium salamii TaxID=1612424 RepID=A0A9W4J103_9EURO|nr:unnamed protein product [Penicillium salamii]CAG8362946.1 unnamed protein product [Penicillium salamii]CAG8365767.1 unnamed protein product [Penicillium salamii]CAG8385688.1 unnamed protein product [Penicillium salamii]